MNNNFENLALPSVSESTEPKDGFWKKNKKLIISLLVKLAVKLIFKLIGKLFGD